MDQRNQRNGPQRRTEGMKKDAKSPLNKNSTKPSRAKSGSHLDAVAWSSSGACSFERALRWLGIRFRPVRRPTRNMSILTVGLAEPICCRSNGNLW